VYSLDSSVSGVQMVLEGRKNSCGCTQMVLEGRKNSSGCSRGEKIPP